MMPPSGAPASVKTSASEGIGRPRPGAGGQEPRSTSKSTVAQPQGHRPTPGNFWVQHCEFGGVQGAGLELAIGGGWFMASKGSRSVDGGQTPGVARVAGRARGPSP